MSDVHTDDIKRTLLDKGKIQHTEVVMYRTVSNDFTPDESLTMTCWYSSACRCVFFEEEFPVSKRRD